MYSLEGCNLFAFTSHIPTYTEINNTQKYAFAVNALKVFITLDFMCTRRPKYYE